MAKAKSGKKVTDIKLAATGEQEIKLSDYQDKNIVLYFYPKDSTPGCTTEGQNFRDAKSKFTRQKTVILGVSRDSIKSHENFKAKQKFNFDLISENSVHNSTSSKKKICMAKKSWVLSAAPS